MGQRPIIRIPLTGFTVHGDPKNVRLVPSPTAPTIPRDQTKQELFVAHHLASVLASKGRTWSGLRSNYPDDPPDVVGQEQGVEFGLEVGEIRLQERAHDGAQLARLKKKVYLALEGLRPRLAGKTLRLHFSDPLALAQEIPARKPLKRMLKEIREAAEQCLQGDGVVTLSAGPLSALRLEDRPCIELPPDPRDPGLVFDANTEATTPEQVHEVARIRTLDKFTRDRFPFPACHLLLWSRDQEIVMLFEAARAGVETGVREAGLAVPESVRRSPYDEIHLLSFSNLGRVAHSSWRRNR